MKTIVCKTLIRHLFSIGVKWQSALCIGIIAAALFAILSSFRLTAQGLYYDELHQAAASFAYTGTYEYTRRTPYMFARSTVYGLPVLNMTYSGALKTGIYGIYLRYFGSHFSIFSWRLLGIIFVSIGVFLFSVIASRRLSLIWLLSFLFLFLTDITVVLATRHDWGPVALAMLIRLLFIVTWIYGETRESTSISNSFFLGSLVGIAIFEKLSSVVLLLPLILIFILSFGRRTFRHCFACIVGGIIGGIPLIIVNLNSFYKYGYLISFAEVADRYQISLSEFPTYIAAYISLGAGTTAKSFILGTGSVTNSYVESIFLGIILLLTTIIDVCYWKQNIFLRLSGVMMLCYVTVGISLYVLPSPTWVHHWIIGTPFQYAAISLTLIGFFCMNNTVNFQYFRIIFTSLIILLMVPRLLGIVSIEKSFQRGEASIHWDPSLTKIGRFASSRANEAVFIAAEWGVASQIFCLSNGRPDLVYELFWNYRGLHEIKNIIEKTGKKIVYIVNKKPRTGAASSTARILRDIEALTGWKEVPVEDEIAELRAVEIRKYSYNYEG